MNNRQITAANIMSLLPSVLANDEDMRVLAETAAQAVEGILPSIESAGIYNRIDELDEGVLDTLAVDLGVCWYDYNWKVETKRRVIASAFNVHRHMGTAGAMKTALCDIWPNSTVEEWWEYGGEPYFFRVLVEANEGSEGEEPIRFGTIDKNVQRYKNTRSWLEGGRVILRISCGIIIGTRIDGQFFGSVICGTTPRTSTHGELDGGGLAVSASVGGFTFTNRPCGTPLGSLM